MKSIVVALMFATTVIAGPQRVELQALDALVERAGSTTQVDLASGHPVRLRHLGLHFRSRSARCGEHLLDDLPPVLDLPSRPGALVRQFLELGGGEEEPHPAVGDRPAHDPDTFCSA